jgi:hypothetical protein
VELPPPSTQGLQFGINNMGIVHIEVGEISEEELASEFSISTSHGRLGLWMNGNSL